MAQISPPLPNVRQDGGTRAFLKREAKVAQSEYSVSARTP